MRPKMPREASETPKRGEERPKGGQREARGRPREAKGRPRGGQGEAKGGQREAKGRPRGGQGRPKGAGQAAAVKTLRLPNSILALGDGRGDENEGSRGVSGGFPVRGRRGGGVHPPIRMGPPRIPCSAPRRVGRRPFGAPEPFQERSKNPSIFQSNFQSILVAFWLPKCLPKPPKTTKKSLQIRTCQKKRDCSKNSKPH